MEKGVSDTMEEGMNVHGEEFCFYCNTRWRRIMRERMHVVEFFALFVCVPSLQCVGA